MTAWYDKLDGIGPTVLDFESHLIVPGRLAPEPVCLASGPVLTHLDPRIDTLLHCRFDRRECLDALEKALGSPLLIGANIPFDLALIGVAFPELWENVWRAFDRFGVWCIQQAEKLIDLADGRLRWHRVGEKMVKVGYSLAEMTKRRFGREMDKSTWRLVYGTLADRPIGAWPQGARDYPMGDLGETREHFKVQIGEPPEKLVDVARQTRAAWWIHLMTCRGFLVDREHTLRLETDIRGEMEAVGKRLREAGLLDAKGKRETKAAGARMEAVLAARGEKPVRTAEGAVELTEEQCEDSGDPLLHDYATYSGHVSLLGKVAALKDAALAGMPIQSRFECILESGRTSCSGGKAKKPDANIMAYESQLQNPPRAKGLRECFVPRRGFVLGSLDYGQLELCTWAETCLVLFGYSKLGEALNKGVDVHCLLGSLLVERTYEEVYAARKKESWAKDARQLAKAGNFGLPGGLGANGLRGFAKASYGVILTEDAAKNLKAKWHEMWPESRDYFRYISKCVGREMGSKGAIVQIRSGRVRGGCGFTEAANGFFQSLAADAAKAAGYELARASYTGRDSAGKRYPALHGSFIDNFVHDEFLFEFPEERAHEAAFEATEIMVRVAAEWMPAVPPKVEPALMRRWSKDAESVYENGRLIPWEPRT